MWEYLLQGVIGVHQLSHRELWFENDEGRHTEKDQKSRIAAVVDKPSSGRLGLDSSVITPHQA